MQARCCLTEGSDMRLPSCSIIGSDMDRLDFAQGGDSLLFAPVQEFGGAAVSRAGVRVANIDGEEFEEASPGSLARPRQAAPAQPRTAAMTRLPERAAPFSKLDHADACGAGRLQQGIIQGSDGQVVPDREFQICGVVASEFIAAGQRPDGGKHKRPGRIFDLDG
jgi:hypothetical protein